ncbi:MAG: SDR family NAD(P)-dependent oxidoreductase [Gammaproteobacteria bacterium]|nr:SDR family NAD(P)-dependent oxidoreductase [Gammaproteobacteria bacterium]
MDLKNKTVLVTGSDGFIGSHLVERLIQEQCKVRAFVYYNSFNHWGWIDSFHQTMQDKIEVIAGDIRDLHCVRAAMKDVEVVFHLAALIAIPFSYNSPESYVTTNINGTLNILQAARDYAIEKLLVTSTSEVYGSATYVPIDEKHPMKGQSPYSATKIAADRLAESFHCSFGLPVTIVRPFNTYGPRQSARAIIPTIITQLLAGEQCIKLGNLTPTRDFNFVQDIVSGFIAICKSENMAGEEINIAMQKEISMGELTQEIINQINPQATIVEDTKRLRPKHSEVERLLGSNVKLKTLTDWEPQYTLQQGLSETIKWMRENLHRYKPHLYNT